MKKHFLSSILTVLCLCSSIIVHAQNWDQTLKAVATSRAANDYFGTSVDIDGDYAVIGAYLESEDANDANTVSNAGSAYIFKNNSGTWEFYQKIVASDRAGADYFGWSVSISGDFIIVGAYSEDHDASGGSSVNNAGSAYIFKLTGGVWAQQQKIVGSSRVANDNFGFSVAISGDHAIVGSYRDDKDASGGGANLNACGAAYIFKQTTGVWAQQHRFVAPVRTANDNFGTSVAISGDHAIVGAYGEDEDASEGNTLSGSGSAFIYKQASGSWTYLQKIVATDREESDLFGISVDISGDHAIVGAQYESQDASGTNTIATAGSAYIFEHAGGVWSQQQKIVASDRGESDQFGRSVAISGDRAIVGAQYEDHDADGNNLLESSGSAYIFEQSAGVWSEQKKLVASVRNVNDQFGCSVAIEGDYAFVGAFNEDEDENDANFLTESGSVYLFELSSPITWDGETDNDWNTATNWDGDVLPTASDNVLIPDVSGVSGNFPVVSTTGAAANEVMVDNGAFITVYATGDLTLSGNLTNAGTVLVLADATGIGSLITLGTITGAGAFQVEQYLQGAGAATPNGVFQYVSSPMPDAESDTYDAAGTDKLWSASEATQAYSEITDNATPLNVGQGYVARMGAAGAVIFQGTAFNTGNVNITGLTRTGNTELNRGYNLVGNPYPSTVNWNTASKTNLEPSIWFRTHNGSTMLFDTYNTTGNMGTNNNGGGAVTNLIPPTQAFWVRVDADGLTGQLDFDNADRSHGAWSSIYKAAAEEGTVRMTLNDGAVSDEAIVYFNSDAQDNFDDFDSHKFWASDVPQLYMNSSADTVAINGLYSTATNPTVDLGLKLPTQGNYTLNANSITIVGETVHLEDRLLNIFQDLNEAPSYAFTSAAGNIGDRFALHFGMSVTGIEGGVVNSRVFAADRLVNVSVGNDITTGMITILDMAGRTVQTATINGSRTVVATDLITGIYLVRVETTKGAETHRVMLR